MTNDKYAQEQMEKVTKAATQQAEEIADFSKSGFEAWIQSTNIFMDGATNLFKSMSNYANSARETQADAMKEFTACKTLNDMTETSTRVAQKSLEEAMNNATELSEKSIKLYMDSFQPINDQISKGFQKTAKKASKAA
jgi:phasin family protein